VRNAIAGSIESIPRVYAMRLRLALDFPNKHRDFEAMIDEPAEPFDIGYAVISSNPDIRDNIANERVTSSTARYPMEHWPFTSHLLPSWVPPNANRRREGRLRGACAETIQVVVSL